MNSSVTVLMTVHNAAPFLGQSIRSILAQTHRDLECLIIDDGSTDDSPAIAQSFDDPRIRFVKNPQNTGQTACLNQGLDLATGDFIARQDADDLSQPRRLELQLAAFNRDPQLVLLGTQGWIINAAGHGRGGFNLPLRPESIRWSRFFANPFIHTSVMFRRGPERYDPAFRICQDYDLWMRLLRTGPGMNLRDRLVVYRVHAASLSRTGAQTVREEVRRILAREPGFTPADIELLAGDLAPAEIPAFLALRRRLMAEKYPGRAGALHLAKIARTQPPLHAARLFAQAAFECPSLVAELLSARLSSP